MCVTDHHDMTLAVKVALNTNTTNQLFFRQLHKWWAQYMESLGEMDTALQFYELSQDFLSLVRVYCYCSNMEKVSLAGCS